MINLGALLSLLAAGDDDVWDQPHRREQAPRLCAAATDVEQLIGRRFLFVEPRSAASRFDTLRQIEKIIILPDHPAN